MRRAPIYSASRRRATRPPDRRAGAGSPVRWTEPGGTRAPEPVAPPAPPRPERFAGLRRWAARHQGKLVFLCAVLVSVAMLAAYDRARLMPAQLTQEDLDGAVLHTLATHVVPPEEARAFSQVIGSVVLVRGLGGDEDPVRAQPEPIEPRPPGEQAPAPRDAERAERTPDDDQPDVSGIGTGVVLVDRGIILTNMHVVAGARRIQVTFADGTESRARIVGLRPDQDLAVLQALTVPEGLQAATVKASTELVPGERVIAIGFPFGIGPSVSSGIVSGLNREFKSQKGREKLKNLIQFDAAANPGNSGGPLVTMDGSVVGIVTAILNPTEDRVFVGIGFAVPIENAASAVGSSPF